MHQWMTSHQYVSTEFKSIKTIFFSYFKVNLKIFDSSCRILGSKLNIMP